MLVSGLVGRGYGDPAEVMWQILAAGGITVSCAAVLCFLTKGKVVLSRRDGFGIVTFGWLIGGTFGALPYVFSGTIPNVVTAAFESMSGFTTTGASVLSNLEDLPYGILFWRSITQWIGGMGVLVLCVAILPFIGVGGMQIYRAEVPGVSVDRLAPRIASTAKFLWFIYLGLSLLQTVLLRVAGMNSFDAICHAFTTMSTGGFSTRSASIAAYDSLPIELILIVFMFVAGVNFSLHFRAMTGKPGVYWRDPEFKWYVGFWAISILFVTFDTWGKAFETFGGALRSAAFQVTTIITTTGFATEDFDTWPNHARLVMLLLMFSGACAGSTSGSMKLVRVVIALKKALREIQLFMVPNAVVHIRFGGKVIQQSIVAQVTAFVLIFGLLTIIASLIMSFFTPDLETATTSVIATLGNIGPGLGAVGPAQNFSAIPIPGQFLLTLLMLLGRLELYTVLVILMPRFWRR